jgi:hypothetical protein
VVASAGHVPGVFQSRNGQAARWEPSALLARGAGRVNTGGWEGGSTQEPSEEAGGVEICLSVL